jgi:hypothetical protein
VGKYGVCACVSPSARRLSGVGEEEKEGIDCSLKPLLSQRGDRLLVLRGAMAPRDPQGFHRAQHASASLVVLSDSRTNADGYFFSTASVGKVARFKLTGWGLRDNTPAVFVGVGCHEGTAATVVTADAEEVYLDVEGVGAGDWDVCSNGELIGRLHVTARAAVGVWVASATPRDRTTEPYDAAAHSPLPRPHDAEEARGPLAVEVQGLGLTNSDRIALLGNNRTCGIDGSGSALTLRIDGRVKAAATSDFARWEPQRLAGPESLFDHVPGRRCTATPAATACDACDRSDCLRMCAEDQRCVAAQISRRGGDCVLHRDCTSKTSLTAPEQDLHFRRAGIVAEESLMALRSKLAVLSFAPVEIAGGLGGTLKVCFCDSTLRPCAGIDSFTVEIGVLHVSDVARHASRPLAATQLCRHQHHDGLACLPVDPVAPNARNRAPLVMSGASANSSNANATNTTNTTNA